jgi:cytochrome c-type biogenesis protein CcmF
LRDPKNRSFSLNPVVYKSRNEQWIQHPDIKKYFEHDLYVAVSPQAMFGEQPSSGNLQFQLRRNEPTPISGTPLTIEFERFLLQSDSAHTNQPDLEISVAAEISLTNSESGEVRKALPVYMIDKNRRQQFLPSSIEDWGVTLSFVGMSVDDGSIAVIVEGLGEAAPDWIVVQAYQKPFINLLWFGLLLTTIGFLMSIYRRLDENKFEAGRQG